MPSPISSANDASPAETRRGRAWIDRTAGVRIGYTLAGSPWMSPDTWCPTPAIGSPRRTPTIERSTAQPNRTLSRPNQ
jgi:hypothetical protein